VQLIIFIPRFYQPCADLFTQSMPEIQAVLYYNPTSGNAFRWLL